MRRIISTLTASAALLLAATADAAPCPPDAGGHYYGSTEIIPDVHASVVMSLTPIWNILTGGGKLFKAP